jgi:hypothetical protein
VAERPDNRSRLYGNKKSATVSAIFQFIRPFDVFDSPTLTVLGKAYDQAIIALHDARQPIIVRETIAIPLFDLETWRT